MSDQHSSNKGSTGRIKSFRANLSEEELADWKDRLAKAATEANQAVAADIESVQQRFSNWRKNRKELVDSIEDPYLKDSVSQ